MSGFKKDVESEDTRECEAMRKMFVGGLNRETSEDAFCDHFGQYGNIVDKVIIKDTETQTSRGFGFVTYDSSDSVEKVFQCRPHVIDGKTLDVKRAMPREYNTSTAHSKVSKLFVGGIGPDLSPDDLQVYIENRHPTSIGIVDEIDFLKDRDTNKNKGFGFLKCSSTDFADRLTISENSFTLKGRTMSLKKAEPKGSEGGGSRPERGRGRGQRGGFQSRGGRGGGGRGGDSSYGGGRSNNDDGYNSRSATSYGSNFSTGYPTYGANAASTGYSAYQSSGGASGGGYGSGNGYSGQSGNGGQSGYGGQSGAQGWGNNKRYQPY